MSSHASAGAIDHHHDPSTATGIPNKKLLWWAFLASDCMFFGALISTHLVYRINPPPGNHVPTQVFDLELTSFSTFILLMSSLMMALAVGHPAGGGALRPLVHSDHRDACEMKRLFVRSSFRGFGLGRLLVEEIVFAAEQAGYATMLLDTLSDMESARALYQEVGFVETEPYYHNPLAGAHYLKLDLRGQLSRSA